MQIVVLTGMSGSGKTNALRALEDMGFYAIDNLPIPLIDSLFELFAENANAGQKLAIVVDVRTAAQTQKGESEWQLESILPKFQQAQDGGHDVHLVFLDARDEVLLRRFSETRRRHPLVIDGSVRSAIGTERAWLEPIRQAATTALDTSGMSVHDLRQILQETFAGSASSLSRLVVSVMSFGFKHGVPPEADLVFDVRFLANPHFVENLRPKTGVDPEVSDYVLSRTETQTFLRKLYQLLDFLIPSYKREGKAYLTIAVGCTGGRHRSVAIAIEIAQWLQDQKLDAQVRHRDASQLV